MRRFQIFMRRTFPQSEIRIPPSDFLKQKDRLSAQSIFFEKLQIQIRNFLCVFFDEFPSGFYFIPHKDVEEVVCFDGIGEFDFQHDPLFRVHSGIPELFRVHFTEPFEYFGRPLRI